MPALLPRGLPELGLVLPAPLRAARLGRGRPGGPRARVPLVVLEAGAPARPTHVRAAGAVLPAPAGTLRRADDFAGVAAAGVLPRGLRGRSERQGPALGGGGPHPVHRRGPDGADARGRRPRARVDARGAAPEPGARRAVDVVVGRRVGCVSSLFFLGGAGREST